METLQQTALITGSSSGIGLAVARRLAQRGANVWLVARDEARLRSAREEVLSQRARPDQRCETISSDLSDPRQAQSAVERVIAVAGVPDLVVNSAGVARPGYFQELDLTVFREAMEINYFGTLHVTKALAPALIERRAGHIVNICSAAGFLGVFGYTAYGASKYAVRGLSDALRAELKPYGVGVSIVFPPDTDTPQLANEAPYKPPETRALGGGVVMTADAVAVSILDGVARRRYIITPGIETSLVYHLLGLLGPLQYPIVDLLVSRAQRDGGRN